MQMVVQPNAITGKKCAAILPTLTGLEVVHLMRKHKLTIRQLAAKMNITQVRVREVRSKGVTGQLYVMDWLEGITGSPTR